MLSWIAQARSGKLRRNAAHVVTAGTLLAALATPAAARSGTWSEPGAPAMQAGPQHFAQARKTTPQPASNSLEVRFWNDIKDRDAVRDFQIYLEAYPDGQFVNEARERLRQLQGGAAAPAPPRSPETSQKPPPAPPPPSKSLDIRPAPVPAPVPASAPPPAAGVVKDCQTCPPLVMIPAGTFNMGSTELFPFEAPVHRVTIAAPFHIGQREVTLAEWDACVADKGCAYSPPDKGADRAATPVTNLGWDDAQQYVAWLSKKTGKAYRLPSESEWEYAARGGTTTTYPWGAKMEKNRANCLGCNDTQGAALKPAASYQPNAFGVYDMLGNAAEWVEDCWHNSYRSAPSDGSAWSAPRCQERVLRGGSFNNDPRYLRSASRFKYDFDVRYYTNGFRVVRP